MGQDIDASRFHRRQFEDFHRRHRVEMDHLRALFADRAFSKRSAIAGLELEAWIVNKSGEPLPINDALLHRMPSRDVVPELSKFNIEFNVPPHELYGGGLDALHRELSQTWRSTFEKANELDADILAIGILPTIEDHQLTLANMSERERYRALNEQVLRLRHGKPIRLDIHGPFDHVISHHKDVMLESVATSLQLHLQVPLDFGHRYYNAAMILAAATVGMAANSPLLFGRRLWDETRIPVFEQAVEVGFAHKRVTFGDRYVENSLESLFLENLEHYPVLLPMEINEGVERLPHIRLHNGTIWRWVRPLLGFDEDNTPHLRIEHRVMAAGPTLVDIAANAAFFYGLVESLATAEVPPESVLDFETCKRNFYTAARNGLDAEQVWLDGRTRRLSALLLDVLLPEAERGLSSLRVDSSHARQWLDILADRVASGKTGAAWQHEFFQRNGSSLGELTCAYRDRQVSGDPVHTWTI